MNNKEFEEIQRTYSAKGYISQASRFEDKTRTDALKMDQDFRDFVFRTTDYSEIFSGQKFTGANAEVQQELIRRCGISPTHELGQMTSIYTLLGPVGRRDAVGDTGANLVENKLVPWIGDPYMALGGIPGLPGANAIISDKSNALAPMIKNAGNNIFSVFGAGSGEQSVTSVIGNVPNTSGNPGMEVGQQTLTAYSITSGTYCSKQLLAQAKDRQLQNYILKLLRKSVGNLCDWFCLNGTGSSQVNGLFNYSANTAGNYDDSLLLPTVTLSGTVSQANISQFIYNFEDANIPTDNLHWLISPSGRQTLSAIAESTGNTTFNLYRFSDHTIAGYPAISSNFMAASNRLIAIDPREIWTLWVSAAEFLVDNWTLAASGSAILWCTVYFGFALSRGACCISTNAI